jgi:hypothetical protein
MSTPMKTSMTYFTVDAILFDFINDLANDNNNGQSHAGHEQAKYAGKIGKIQCILRAILFRQQNEQ